jgi:hypothetical protein
MDTLQKILDEFEGGMGMASAAAGLPGIDNIHEKCKEKNIIELEECNKYLKERINYFIKKI